MNKLQKGILMAKANGYNKIYKAVTNYSSITKIALIIEEISYEISELKKKYQEKIKNEV